MTFTYPKDILAGVELLDKAFDSIDIKSEDSDLEKQVMLILFLEKAFEKTKLSRVVFKSGGKFDEILAAFQLGLKLNDKMTGPDLIPQAHAQAQTQAHAVEIKTSNVSMDTKTNFNFTAPVRARGVTTNALHKEQVLKHYRALGDVRLAHKPSSTEETHYLLSAEFVGHMVWTLMPKNKTPHKVNIGGMACPNCKHVHRVMYYMKLDKEFSSLLLAEEKAAFNFERLRVSIPSASGCAAYVEFRTKSNK